MSGKKNKPKRVSLSIEPAGINSGNEQVWKPFLCSENLTTKGIPSIVKIPLIKFRSQYMKKALLLPLLLVLSQTAFGQAQSLLSISAGPGGYLIFDDKTNTQELDLFAGISVKYTRIWDSGFTFVADMGTSLPVYINVLETDDPDINEGEVDLTEYEFLVNTNLYLGAGYALVNQRRMFLTLSGGISLNNYAYSYLLGLIKVNVNTVGVAADLGMGFFIGRKVYLSLNVKGGFNFAGISSVEFNDEVTQDDLEGYSFFFLVPTIGIGFEI
jgi:hypothetical protein